METKARQNFRQACNILNNHSLDNLLKVSSILSAIEFYENDFDGERIFFPLINQNNLSMFSRTILYSKSNFFKREKLKCKWLSKVINKCNEASERVDIFEDESLDDEEKMYSFIGALHSSQIWFQRQDMHTRIALLFAFYKLIPEKIQEELKSKYKTGFIDIPKEFESVMGISPEKYFVIIFYLRFQYFKGFYQEYIKHSQSEVNYILEGKNDEQINQRKVDLICKRVEDLTLQERITLHQGILANGIEFINSDDEEAFWDLVSAGINEMRDNLEKEPYQKGHISQRLNPLERYPVVKNDFGEFIIPNFRYFEIGSTDFLRFPMMQAFSNNEYSKVMGSVQEKFLLDLTEQKLPYSEIIPEQSYEKKEGTVLGPDLTIIENDRLIVLESKVKHILLETRLQPNFEGLMEDLDSAGVVRAFEKLRKQKIPDLYSDFDAYKPFQDQLDNTKQKDPITVAVIGKGIHGMQESINFYLDKYDPDHYLNNYPFPFVILDVDTFYRMVEVANTHGFYLHELLLEYWDVAKKNRFQTPSADQIGNRSFDLENSIAKEYLSRLVDNLK